ncbi:MAG: xanthine phosphoribosyltransferase [Hyphomicrobiales bacterium]
MSDAKADQRYHVTWEQFHSDTCLLAESLSSLRSWDVIVAITRGGLVPAAIVAFELNICHIETISIASYDDENKQGDIALLKPVSDQVLEAGRSGSGVLIIDDLVDTGKTARAVREMMPKAYFATVYAKPDGRPLVDRFTREVSQNTWVYFPWDKVTP